MCYVLEWILFLSCFSELKLFWVGGIIYGNLYGFVNSLTNTFDIVTGPFTEVTLSKLYIFALIFLKRDDHQTLLRSVTCTVHFVRYLCLAALWLIRWANSARPTRLWSGIIEKAHCVRRNYLGLLPKIALPPRMNSAPIIMQDLSDLLLI